MSNVSATQTLVIDYASNNFSLPAGSPLSLSASQSGTFTFAPGTDSQAFTGYGNADNTLDVTGVPDITPICSNPAAAPPVTSCSTQGTPTTFTRSGNFALAGHAEITLAVGDLATFQETVAGNSTGACSSAIGDFVWDDLNHNGIQDSGEPGIPNITVNLMDSTGTNVLATTTTDNNGKYQFTGLCAGTYTVQIPSQPGLTGPGFTATTAFQGGSPQNDSNGQPQGAAPPQTAQVILPDNTVDNSIDFGYVTSPNGTCVSISVIQGVAITPVTMTGSGGVGGPYTFSATGLPPGITMSSNGTISGMTTSTGTFNYTVTVMDRAGNTGTVNCSVTVYPPPTATCVSISAIQGVAITPVTMTGSGGVGGPYTFSATGLPPGITISTGGTISGIPTSSGTFLYTVTVTDSAGNKGTVNCSVTVGPPPPPSISLTKTANPTSAAAFAPVTYTYTVTNTGSTTLTNVKVVDDNGTPGYTADDFVVGTIASLAPFASQTFTATIVPVVNECVTVGSTNTPAGILIATVLPSGDLKIVYRQSTALVDNAYGTSSVSPADNWPSTHKFSDLTGSDQADFQIYDGAGNLVLDFLFDYLSSSSAYPSGYGTLGVSGGDGKLNSGNAAWVLGVLSPATLSDGTVVRSTTTITTDLNQSSAFYGYTTNSPAPGDPNLANWELVDGYTVYISKAAFGSNGFGKVLIPYVHNSPSKVSGTIKFFPTPCSGNVTNTATVTDDQGVVATAQATVSITGSSSGGGGGTPPPALKFSFPAGTNGTVGTPYSVTLAATGGVGPYTYSVSAGTLPAGLTLDPSTGAITGTPTKAVGGPAANITFKVTDSESPAVSVTAAGAINIAAPPPLKLPFPPGANGKVGTPYNVTLAATGGVGPYTYSVSAGTPPAGLTLNSSTGAITGTPTKAVGGPAANITFKVTDSQSPAASATAAGAININP